MEKNYYEILEVDKNASQEIIKKAYSTLAKKYHPDLQPEDKKNDAEIKFKLINEAYETLSNEESRKEYDSTISIQSVPYDQYNSLFLENQQLKAFINEMHKKYLRDKYIIDDSINNNISNSTHHDNFVNNNLYSQNKNIQNNYKDIFFSKLKSLLAIFLTIMIIYFLLKIPFIHKLIFGNILK